MGKLAFVFSGQGAQYEGMGAELCRRSAAARRVFDTADGVREGTSKQCFTAGKEALAVTANTQPCVFCVDLAAAMSLREAGVTPDAVAGFSLGEIAALTFAGVFTLQGGFAFVCRRAYVMQRAAEKSGGGMMAVLGLPDERVERLCEGFEKVYPVNYNCPGQLVVAGDRDELSVFREAVRAAGGKAVPLPVGGGFHSPFMDEAAQEIAVELAAFALEPPEVPVYANSTALPYGGDMKALLSRQVNSPVLWRRTIEQMVADRIDTFVETGPGKTLCGLIKKTAPGATVYNVEDEASLVAALAALCKGERQC